MENVVSDLCDADVQVLPKTFRGLHEWDSSIQRLKVIVVLPQCSLSALSDPVATIHSEQGGNQLAATEICKSEELWLVTGVVLSKVQFLYP